MRGIDETIRIMEGAELFAKYDSDVDWPSDKHTDAVDAICAALDRVRGEHETKFVQEIGESVELVRLGDVPGMPEALEHIRILIVSNREDRRDHRKIIAVDATHASFLLTNTTVRLHTADKQTGESAWIEGLTFAADELRRRT